MDKVEQIENLLTEWKTAYEKAKINNYYRGEMQAKGGIKALNAALSAIKQPSNKVVEDGQAYIPNNEVKPIKFPKITTSG